MLSKRGLSQQLRALGLGQGDFVMVHASLRKLGPVAGGAAGVIESIIQVVGRSGTMLMPIGSKLGDIFCHRTSVADPDSGVLAEQFRRFPGVTTNDHPAARFCALGSHAEQLLSPVPLNDYYGDGSVLERFIRSDGKALRLGADIDTMTITHWAEYMADVSPKRRVIRDYQTLDHGDLSIESLDDVNGIQEWPGGDYFGQILRDYIASSKAKRGSVGTCQAELIDAKDYAEFAISWMESHLTRRRS